MIISMKIHRRLRVVILLMTVLLPALVAGQAPPDEQPAAVEPKKLALGATAACEAMQNGIPENKAVAFSSAIKKVYCYTNFTSVPEKMFTFHNWYLRDNLKASIKLVLRPSRWSTYSAMELRSSDKGPWRVEVTDEEGNILSTLRFSIID
jgi:hypothetical protein